MLDELFIRGGPVLYLLFGLTFLIFLLLIDKYIFIFIQSRTWVKEKFNSFMKINPPSSTKYKFVEATLISNVKRKTASNIKILDGLIGMCPMIGLLGTVYGMIEVFEVLSFLGTGNPRAMSSGVAKATIPTMASMVITLFGLYFRQDLTQRINKATEKMKLLIKQKGYSH
jgi:biopolymer transport protein ExbB